MVVVVACCCLFVSDLGSWAPGSIYIHCFPVLPETSHFINNHHSTYTKKPIFYLSYIYRVSILQVCSLDLYLHLSFDRYTQYLLISISYSHLEFIHTANNTRRNTTRREVEIKTSLHIKSTLAQPWLSLQNATHKILHRCFGCS